MNLYSSRTAARALCALAVILCALALTSRAAHATVCPAEPMYPACVEPGENVQTYPPTVFTPQPVPAETPEEADAQRRYDESQNGDAVLPPGPQPPPMLSAPRAYGWPGLEPGHVAPAAPLPAEAGFVPGAEEITALPRTGIPAGPATAAALTAIAAGLMLTRTARRLQEGTRMTAPNESPSTGYAPNHCLYCDGTDPNCGFCEMGKPLDTQADWDRSWGRVLRMGDYIAADRYDAAAARNDGMEQP